MFSAQRVLNQSLRYFLMRLCRRLYTASQLMMPPHNYRSRSSSSGASYPMTLQTAELCHRHIAMLVAPHRLNLLTLLRFVAPSSATHASDCHEHTTAPHVLLQPPPVSRSMPGNMPHKVYLVKRHRCDLVCVHLSQLRPQSHMSVPPKWEHILCAQLLPAREVLVPPERETTILLVQILVQGRGPFPKPREPW